MTELPPRPRTESELVELIRSSDVRAPDSLHPVSYTHLTLPTIYSV